MGEFESYNEKTDYLDVDKPIPGQSFVCLSFISPEKVIQSRDAFMFSEFLKLKGIDMVEYTDYVEQNEEDLEKTYHKFNNFKTSVRGLKVRGVYDTADEAKIRAEQVRASDSNFDVFVAPVGYWLPWDPSPDSVKEKDYMDKNLNELMFNYHKNREQCKEHFAKEVEERKKITREEGQRGANELKLNIIDEEITTLDCAP